MAEFNSNDQEKAQNIIDGIFNDNLNSEQMENGLTIYDVERDYYDLVQSQRIARELFGGQMLALKLGNDNVPVSFSTLGLNPSIPWWYFTYPNASDRDIPTYLSHPDFVIINEQEAVKTFRSLAVDFIATRIASLRDVNEIQPAPRLNLFRRWSGGNHGGNGRVPVNPQGGGRVQVPSCSFQVTSTSSGLRVLWSGAYYIVSNAFGSPTSPVSGPLAAGNYIFGVDGGAYGNMTQWDYQIISLPGPTANHHLNY